MGDMLNKISAKFDKENFKKLNEGMSFSEYIDLVYKNPRLARTAYQYLYDMITSKGTSKIERYRRTYIRYKFFDDSDTPIFGLDETLHQIVQFFKGAAGGYGPERRFLLLHGPVGSSKSTILRCIKKGLEKYSLTDEGAWYTFKWVNLPTGKDYGIYTQAEDESPMHEDPLKLLPPDMRKEVVDELNKILVEMTPEKERTSLYRLSVEGELDPRSKKFMQELLSRYEGDWGKVVENHIRVVRKTHSEADRCGIATFQPKDEKNQDSTELTGDINWGKLPHFGSDSDARCVTGDTLISTDRGFVRISELLDGQTAEPEMFLPLSAKVSSLGGETDAVNVYFGGMKDVHKVITKFGYSITSTGNHKLLTLTEDGIKWKKVNDLETGDYVALGRGCSTFSDKDAELNPIEFKEYGNERNKPTFPTKITPELGYFFGLWIGDGHYSINKENAHYEFGWTQKEPDRLESFKRMFKENFSLEFNETPHNNTTVLRISSRKLVEWLHKSAGLRGKSSTKKIPDCILKSTKETIVACLRGLWETDGNIRSNHGSNTAFFCTNSFELASQVQRLLLSFGIVSSLQKAVSDMYSVLVYGKNVNLLCELIPQLKGRFTTGQLAELKSAPNADILPNIKPLMVAIYKKFMAKLPNDSEIKNRLKKRYGGNLFDSRKKNVSYETLNDFLSDFAFDKEDLDYIRLKEIQDANHVWMPVQEVISCGRKEVFDLYVPETNAYWADGFVSHNSFNFDGEFCVGNRGLVEFIEVLKLAKEFLYDLLGASQEKQIKPKKFPQVAVDTVLVGHTNSPEFIRLKSDQTMEALRDRTVKIDVPYLLRWSDELKVLENQYSGDRIKQHIAPHTLEIAALWSVLTRLQDDKDGKISLVEKAKLYDGRSLPGWTEDSVKEMRDKYPDEGMIGISCRYTQDKISNCLSSHYDYINFFMVLNELKAGIDHQSLLNNQEDKSRYVACIDLAKKELDEILKTEVQKALVGDEHAIERLCGNYIDNVMAYINGTKIKNPFTEQDQEPDERLMRSIEEKIDIPEVGADDFRRMLAGFIGHLAHSGKQFKWDSNPQLKKALEAKLFEDTKDHIKLSALNIKGATVVDKEIQEKIDAVKKRLISQYGYNEQSATDVLEYISSIFARGDVSED